MVLRYSLFLLVIASGISKAQTDDVYTKASEAVFFIKAYDEKGNLRAQGTGFFITPDGKAVTAWHILREADSVFMVNKKGEYYYFDSLIKPYPSADIVQFRIKPDKVSFPFIPLTRTILYEGDDAFAMGICEEKDIYVSEGLVSIIRMFHNVGPGLLAMINMADVHNGGPLVNINGEAIGIISFPLVLKYDINFALSAKVITDEEDRLSFVDPRKVDTDTQNEEKRKATTDKKMKEKFNTIDFELFREKEIALKELGDSIRDGANDFSKMDALTDFIPLFRKTLLIPGSYNYPFDSLTFINILYAPDNSFRIFSWTLPFENQTYRYYGAIQKNNYELDLIPLFDYSQKADYLTIQDSFHTNQTWFGAQYYDIMMIKHRKNKYYVLLGWNGNHLVSNRKIIEIVHFDKYGNLILGAPIVDYIDETLYRKVIQYNNTAIVVLKAIHSKNIIAFDHLVPPAPKDEGKLWLYIPDGNYDYFKVVKGRLVYHQDLFVNEKISKEDIEGFSGNPR